MLNLISSYWPVIVLLVVALFLIITGQWVNLRTLAFKLMLSAERLLSESSGRERFEFVFKTFYRAVPGLLKCLFPEESLRAMLQKWYTLAKDCLDDVCIKNSIL